MCDFSLMSVQSRPAAVGDKLVSTGFSTSTSKGFAGCDNKDVAVCILPGTEIAFDENIKTRNYGMYVWGKEVDHGHKVARFRQVDKHIAHKHHDALELPDGTIVMLNDLIENQTATVLQLPAAPKTDAEVAEQERIPVVA